jgi:hypothetical protein
VARQLRLPPIDRFLAALGSWEIDEEEVDQFRQDTVIVGVFVASVGNGSFSRNKSDGSTMWRHKLEPLSVRVATGEMRDELIEIFHLSSPGDQLSFELGDRPARIPPVAIDADTGEIIPDEAVDVGTVEPHLPPVLPPPAPGNNQVGGHAPGPPPLATAEDDFFAAENPLGALRTEAR